jgi:hydrogenase nickel incorporation protein HypB
MAVRVIEIHENVYADNNREAEALRKRLKASGTFMLNIMSAPGSGKTTLLTSLVNLLKDEFKIGIMDVDIETSLDATKVADATGVKALQIHNGGLCHIDAEMTRRAIDEFDAEGLDIIFLENIGNLVCPAEFDTGAHKNMMLFSLPEGDDKPLKYPLMFSISDLTVISKIDTKDYFDFDFDKAKERIRKLNPKGEIISLSAKTGEGMEELADWVRREVKGLKTEQ